MTLHPKKFCVYRHIGNGEVFYIGMGISSRPFSLDGRNDRWSRKVMEFGEYGVEIIGWFESRKEALKEEAEQIKSNKPYANVPRARPHTGVRRGTGKNSFLHIRASRFDVERWERAAALDHRTLSDWIRLTLAKHMALGFKPAPQAVIV